MMQASKKTVSQVLFVTIVICLFAHASLVEGAPFPATVELSALDGVSGFVINGIAGGGESALNVSSAGDINGDGVDDLIIGAPAANQSYVAFGTNQGFPSLLELSALDGTNGFIINGIGASGTSVSAAGDVNGDGIDDVIIGAWNASPGGRRLAGQSYVVFGTDQGFPALLALSALDGTNGFALNGIAETDFSGISVSAAGDVNGDGVDDLIIGANGVDRDGLFNVGQGYVVFGTDQGFPAALELSALDGSNGFALNGVGMDHFDNAGLSVSSAGDVNHDGIDDVIIGVPSASIANRDTAGQSSVVFGTDRGSPAAIDLSALDGANGFVNNGVTDGDFSGKSVSAAGDVNGDGIDDFIIGANGASPNGIPRAGQSYVVFGTDQGFPAALELSALDGTNGFALNGIAESDFSGISVSAAGDINGDGMDDVIIGAPFASPNPLDNPLAGQSYVVFGTDQGFPAALELSTLDGTNGFTLNGIAERNRSGWSVSAAADVNGDGIDDLVIGSNFSDPNDIDEPGQSQSYVVFGRSPIAVVYVSSSASSANVDGVFFRDEDIVAYDINTDTWSMHFDGSDVGVGGTQDLNAFHIDADGSILMALARPATLPDVGSVEPADIVRFIPTSTGGNTAGTFAMVLDGSDVELGNSSGERIDAIGMLPDGRIVISTQGNFNALGVRAKDEDLIAFDATKFGPNTLGFDSVRGLAFDPNTNTLYGSDVDRDELITIDPTTGIGTTVGPFNLGASAVVGLAFDPVTNTLYGVEAAGDQLITIDTTTGEGTVVGGLGGFFNVFGLAFDPNTNTLYGSDITANALITIDTTTGAGTAVGVTAGFGEVSGLAFDANTNTLYGTNSPPGTLPEQLIIIDPANGMSAVVGLLGFNEVRGLAFDANTNTAYGSDLITDLLLAINTATGAGTGGLGSWEFYFDGSDVELSATSSGDVNGVWVDDTNGNIYLTFLGAFTVTGASGDELDIIVCTPDSVGASTSCTYSTFFDGSIAGLTGADRVDGISLGR